MNAEVKIKWATLATWSDEEILRHFKNDRNMDERHANNALRFLRTKLGNGRGAAAPVPATPAPAPTYYGPDLKTVTPSPTPVVAPVVPAPMPPTMPAGEGLAPLAAMLAPHLAPTIGGHVASQLQASIEAIIAARVEQAASDIHAALEAKKPTPIVIQPATGEARALPGLHHYMAPKLLKLTGVGLNVMMVGPAGCGKTVLGKSVAAANEKTLTLTSCSAGMSETQLLGRLLPLGAGGAFGYVESPFVKAYREGGVILLDEIDAADANLLLVINAALANGEINIEARAASGLDTRVVRHPETIIMAAANTWGSGADTQYVGRGALDVSTLDRFYRLEVDYDAKLEAQLADDAIVTRVHAIRHNAREAKLRRVVSTRMITRVAAAMRAGFTMQEALDDELRSWSKEERAKVGAN